MRVLREELSPYVYQLFLCCHVVDGDVLVLDQLLPIKEEQSGVFRARPVGAVSFHVWGSFVVAKER